MRRKMSAAEGEQVALAYSWLEDMGTNDFPIKRRVRTAKEILFELLPKDDKEYFQSL